MFGLGWGEIAFIGVIAMMLVGPAKLPQYAAQGAKWLRELRVLIDSARSDLVASAGIDEGTLSSLADLHPKNIASSLLGGDSLNSLTGLTDDPAQATAPVGATPTRRSNPRGSSELDPDAT